MVVFGSFGGKHKAYKTDFGQKALGVAKKGVKALGTALVVGGGVYMAANHAKDRAEDKIDAALTLGDEVKDIGKRSADKAKRNPLKAKDAIEGGVKEAELLARTVKVAGVEPVAKTIKFRDEVRRGEHREELQDRVVKPRLPTPREVGGFGGAPETKSGGSRQLAQEGGGAFDNRACDRNYPGLLNRNARKACKEQGRPEKKKKKKGRFR
tara:strand:- start:208 stop:837 length:630 start_codon:yes stop_codon:yes gene_type:complete